MRAVVIQNQMHIQIGGNLSLDRIQKLSELDRTMTLVKMADDVAGFQIESGNREVVPCRL